MDLYYRAGKIKALEKLGYWKPEDLKRYSKAHSSPIESMIRKHPGLAVGGAIGTGLGLNTLVSKEEPRPRMEPPAYAGNPLTYQPQY